jgi:hypothetical protein
MEDFGEHALVGFNKKVWVRCPNCNGLAEITTDREGSIYFVHYTSNFKCYSCNESKLISGLKLNGTYQGIINSPCSFCNEQLSYTIEPVTTMVTFETLVCKNCGTTNKKLISYQRLRDYRPIDPFFYFELWLQFEFKSEIIWFYNLDHLSFVKGYISSKLRPDNTRQKYSLVSNLPKFMLLAKNRDAIVKKITELEDQFLKALKEFPKAENIT